MMAYEIFCNTTKLLVSEEKTLHDLLRIIGPVVQRRPAESYMLARYFGGSSQENPVKKATKGTIQK
jgi:hypothetical protein